MPFSGPRRQSRAVRPFDPHTFDLALTEAENQSRPRSIGRFDTSLMEHQDRVREREEAGRADLAMTPGVREGMVPSWEEPSRNGVGVADSPYLKPQQFERFGKHYSYDPTGAARAAGAVRGAAEASADDVRFQALQKIPGISPVQAGRLVFGRSMASKEDDQEPMRTALSDYMMAPSRESAAAAVRAGASLNQFPDRFAGDAPADPMQTRGTPEHEAMLGREADIRNAHDLTPGFTPGRERIISVKGPNGEIGRQNLDTNDVDWSGAVGARPSGAKKESSLSRAMGATGRREPIPGQTDPATVEAYKASHPGGFKGSPPASAPPPAPRMGAAAAPVAGKTAPPSPEEIDAAEATLGRDATDAQIIAWIKAQRGGG